MKNKVVFVVEDKKSAQYRYRCQNVMAVLDKEKWDTECFLASEVVGKQLDVKAGDIVLIERQTAKNSDLLRIINSVRKNGAKVVFDLDDLIFDYRDIPVLMRGTNSRNIPYWLGYFWGIRRIAKKVDGFIVTNDFLGKKIKRSFEKPYKVIRNSLNKEQVDGAKHIKKKKTNKFSIGYFSGSPTHRKDFEMIQPQLIGFLNAHEDAEVIVVGYMEFSGEAKEYCEKGRIRLLKPVDYLKLLGLMSEVDVNIAPLVINDFTNCKSELKFFEAGLVETTTIASPSYTFSRAISDGENGLLAKPDEWFKKLEFLYNDSAANRKIAKSAKEYSLKNYYGDVFKKEVEEAYEFFTK